jgi:hypothetical protein
VGELGHSQSSQVSPERIATRVTKLQKHSGAWYGRSRVINSNGPGRILENLIESGVALGASTKSLGTATKQKDGTSLVTSPLHVVSIDSVHSPSGGPQSFLKKIHECIMESRASDTLTSQEITTALQIMKDYSPMDVLKRVGLDKYPEIVKAQLDTVLDWDAVYGYLQSPHSDLTFLERIEQIRAELLRKIVELNQREIELQQDQILQTRDPYSYGQHLSATSKRIQHTSPDPIKAATLRREHARIEYAGRLMNEAHKLLSRIGGGGRIARDDTIQESIIRNAGGRIASLREEEHAITAHYRKGKK